MEKEINDLPTFFRNNYKNFKQNDSMAIKVRVLDSQRSGEIEDNTPYVPLYFKSNSYKKKQKSKLLNEIIDKQTNLQEFEKEVNQFFSETKNVPYIPKME